MPMRDLQPYPAPDLPLPTRLLTPRVRRTTHCCTLLLPHSTILRPRTPLPSSARAQRVIRPGPALPPRTAHCRTLLLPHSAILRPRTPLAPLVPNVSSVPALPSPRSPRLPHGDHSSHL